MTEYLAENSRLRQLSRRYAEGQLPFEEYRAARREILEALEAGETQSAEPAEPESVVAPVAASAPAHDSETVFLKTMPPQVPALESASSTAVATADESAGWDSHTRILAVILGVSLLLALSALVYVFAL